MKSIQLYSLPSVNETSGLNCLSLLNQINCKLWLPNDALWEWNCSLMGESHGYSQESKLLHIPVLSLIYFSLWNHQDASLPHGVLFMNHVMEQCIHAMDNNFPIRKNISLNTTHFLSSFHILKQEPVFYCSTQMQFPKWPHSVRKSVTQKSAFDFYLQHMWFSVLTASYVLWIPYYWSPNHALLAKKLLNRMSKGGLESLQMV